MNRQRVYIVDGASTPFGKFCGAFNEVKAVQLASEVISRLVQKTNIDFRTISGVFMGQALQAGCGQNPARQAALGAGLLNSCDAVTVNKVCSSSLEAIYLAATLINIGDADCIIAGGMESMSRAPYFLQRNSTRFGDTMLIDCVLRDGLEDAYGIRPHMGRCADQCAQMYRIFRHDLEEYAFESCSRAFETAKNSDVFNRFLVPISTDTGVVVADEGIQKPDRELMRIRKPAFSSDGIHTSATSSKLADGAAAVLLASEKIVEEFNVTPMAEYIAYATYHHESKLFITAPIGAISSLLKKTGSSIGNIDQWEINEAFSIVPYLAIRELEISPSDVNIYGGSIAFGHPLGATGARLLLHLLYGTGRVGVVSTCNGGGGASALMIKKIS